MDARAPRKFPGADLPRMLRALGLPRARVGVFLLSDGEMRALKARTTGARKRVVDVLAFPEPGSFPHPESTARFLGEVYLNAERYGSDLSKMRFLLAHALLHLVGFRHDGRRDTMEMKRMERKLL